MNIEDLLKIIASGENEKVEFKRMVTNDLGEEIVALSNSGGGVIVIGVDDSGRIIGCNVKESKERISSFLSSITPPVKVSFFSFNIDGHEVLVLEIKESKSIVTIGGIAYIRAGTSKRPLSLPEILSLGAEYALIPLDSTHTSTKSSEIDRDIWRWFLKKRTEKGLKEIKRLKEKLGITKKVNGKELLTLAGLLFFHKNPQETMPHTYVRIRYGDSWDRVGGPVWKQVEETIKRIMNILPRTSILKGISRVEISPIPVEVLREAVVNALVHRNYGIYSEVFVDIEKNVLRIRNPGSFPPGVSPENPIPIPRNPILYELLFEAGYVERQGGGIEMMKHLCMDHNINMKYDVTPYYTTLSFKIPIYESLGDLEKNIISLLSEPHSSSEIASVLGLSKPTILKKLKTLEKTGLVKSVGRGPKTKWKIT